jgi:putative transposase
MARKRYAPEKTITKLWGVEILLSQDQTIAQACKSIEVSEQTYYRWHTSLGCRPPAPATFMA